jgi:hypothetical protein
VAQPTLERRPRISGALFGQSISFPRIMGAMCVILLFFELLLSLAALLGPKTGASVDVETVEGAPLRSTSPMTTDAA